MSIGARTHTTDRNFDLLQSTREDPFLKGGAILAGMGAWLGEKCRPTETVLRLITLVIELAEGVEMRIQQLPQLGCVRIARLVEW